MIIWLLLAAIRDAIMEAKRNPAAISAEARTEIMAAYGSTGGGVNSRIMSVAGSTAEIVVRGVLTQNFDFEAYLFGGGNTTYTEIIRAIAEANANDSVDDIVLNVTSPGGEFGGLYATTEAIRTSKKPIKAKVEVMAASAAFALVCACTSIEAVNKAARFGSVGTIVRMPLAEGYVEIASTASPKKAPDVATEAGRAVVREELDAVAEVFIGIIADGRKTTIDKVKADYGQGGMFLAEESLKRGMIDSIGGPTTSTTTARIGGTKTESKMDLKTLRAEHPGVYAEAMQAGAAAERDRVSAHLVMGEASGDMATATKAIKEGSEMTALIQANYMAASMKNQEIGARSQDDQAAGGALGGAANAPEAAAKDMGDDVAKIISAHFGIAGVK